MDRTVPRTGSEEIELYIRTYYSLLRSTTDVQIRTLEEVHANMGSALHPNARSASPDISAFIYTGLRLPSCISQVERDALGQSQEVFEQGDRFYRVDETVLAGLIEAGLAAEGR